MVRYLNKFLFSKAMRIAIAGAGYVGLVTAACFAELGNDVICIDIDEDKIKKLNNNVIPIYEPGLKEIVIRNNRPKKINRGVRNNIHLCWYTSKSKWRS